VNLLIFGFGFTGGVLARRMLARGWTVTATARKAEDRAAAQAQGVRAFDPADARGLAEAAGQARAILVTAPPSEAGCPALQLLAPAIAEARAFPDWIGYLSTTGVYGDRGGRWVFETSALNAHSIEGARRVGAERDWLEMGRGMGLTVTVFRLPGIYGPGRSPFDRLRAGTARRLVKPGHVFSRIHVEDLAAGLEASIGRPRPRSPPTRPACWAWSRRRRSRSTRAPCRRRPSASTPSASASPTPGPRPSSAGVRPIRPTARG
jgi:nucleoside-diphosphate-sugar epimerase